MESLITRFGRVLQRKRCDRRRAVSARSTNTAEVLEARTLLTLNIAFDYSLDSSGFFNDQERRDALERAAASLESRINDTLNEISPGGGDSWTARFRHPTTGVLHTLSNLTIPADTIVVYVGARTLTGLAEGGPGGFSASGSQAFLDNLTTRGETGIDPDPEITASNTDFALWGGQVSFRAVANWHFGPGAPPGGTNDFYSVALHELGHVLGIGTAPPWENQINGSNQFTGTEAAASFGGPVPLNADSDHFAYNTTSVLPGTAISQEASLDPDITTGTRKEYTELDWAGFDDIGWELVDAVLIDYGDAPDTAAGTATDNYQTTAADNGPGHLIDTRIRLGSRVDSDNGLFQNSSATADDVSGHSGDDEDGLIDSATDLTLHAGVIPTVRIRVTNTTGAPATLFGWIDYNGNGVFENATERASIAVPTGVSDQTMSLTFPAVPGGFAGVTFARFRLSTDGAAASASTGPANDGEVEDYSVTIRAVDFGDAPDASLGGRAGNYFTTAADNGPVHIVDSQLRLGDSVDADSGTLQNSTATADDNAGDDEDGVIDPSLRLALVAGLSPVVSVKVTNNTGRNATLTGWIDYNGNGVFGDLSESAAVIVPSGASDATVALVFPAVPLASVNSTFARFRLSTDVAGQSPIGFASDGEVEDYAVTITRPGWTDTLPRFEWTPTTGANSYELWINDLTRGQPRVVHEKRLPTNEFLPYEGLLPGTYRIWVRAFNGNTPITGWDPPADRTIVPGGDVPTLSIPEDNPNNPLPLIAWSAVNAAVRYEVSIDDITNSVPGFVRNEYVTTPWFRPAAALPPGTYRATVRASTDGATFGTASEPVDFQISATAAVRPTITAPYSATTNVLPTFAWSPVIGATHYDLWVNDITNGTSQVVRQRKAPTASFTPRQALGEATYRFWVRAYNATGPLGNWSTSQEFTVKADAGGSRVLAPNDIGTNPLPTFAWSIAANTSRYELWVNNITTSTGKVIYENQLTETSFIADQALPVGHYRTWIRTFDLAGNPRAWSAGLDFEVTLAADTMLLSPETFSTVAASNVIFAWTQTAAATGSFRYELWVNDVTNSVARVIHETSLQTQSYVPPTPLTAGLYRAWVRLFDTNGTALPWSSGVTFTVG